MKYKFFLKRNVHMYNHLITCICEEKSYEAICESAPTKEETILFWPDDFKIPYQDKDELNHALLEWSRLEGFKCIINEGARVKQR